MSTSTSTSSSEPVSDTVGAPEPSKPGPIRPKPKRTLMERIDAFVSKLSTRNNFWHRVCSMIWLPYAARSGITMRRVDENTFSARLPFRRFNRNWYNAMAGAALLGNAEVAGGSYVFGVCGGDYTVVCKHLEYKFMRPCVGPAEYRVTPREDIKALVETGKEFNITVDMEIVQLVPRFDKSSRAKTKKKKKDKPKSEMTLKERLGGREKRVGRCNATFHVTPKVHQKSKGRKFRA